MVKVEYEAFIFSIGEVQESLANFFEVQPLEEQVNKQRKRVGILGGTFNPPHIGHLMMAEQVKQNLDLDQVLLMPSFMPPHADAKKTIEPWHREKMVEIAVSDNPNLGIERIELQRPGKSYTVDTMRLLKREHPDTEYYFIIGGDMVEYLPKWYQIEELLTLVQFVGIKREGYSDKSPYPIIWVDMPTIAISSTLIRESVRNHQSIRYMVTEGVQYYIKEEGLYVEKPSRI